MAMTYEQASTVKAANATKNPTFASAVDYADERVSVLLNRLSNLADRLVGSQPSDPSENLMSVPDGVFDDVMRKANSIATRADIGIDVIARIERSLP